jgi:hypothetical protein
MSIPAAWQQVLDFFGTPLVIEPSAGQLDDERRAKKIEDFWPRGW